MEWRNDPVIQGKYVNIYRDGELSAQAVAISSDTNKVGIIYNVMLDGQWSKNEFELYLDLSSSLLRPLVIINESGLAPKNEAEKFLPSSKSDIEALVATNRICGD